MEIPPCSSESFLKIHRQSEDLRSAPGTTSALLMLDPSEANGVTEAQGVLRASLLLRLRSGSAALLP